MVIKSWTAFHWETPNFLVRSIPDNEVFKVERECLIAGSGVFRDMFATCDSGYVLDMLDEEAETLELNEPSATLNMLFNCLHYPPEPYTEPPKSAKEDFTRVQFKSSPESSIPFPILPPLLRLADKFAFTDELTHCLRSHLSAYVATYPLRVYGYAVELGMDAVAAKASMFLLDPPISSYSAEDMKAVPSAEALQRLVLLHDYRITKLKEILGGESIFPHDYGLCSKHGHKTRNLWEQRKTQVLPKIQAATDVAAEMGSLAAELQGCDTCSKAWTAAVSMLAYKCVKVPRRVDKIPM